MNNFKTAVIRAGILIAAMALTACAGTPAVTDPTALDNPNAAENESGLGSVAYEPRHRRKCRKRRQTGTRLDRSSCDDSVRSQPVRDLTYNDPALSRAVSVGPAARPAN